MAPFPRSPTARDTALAGDLPQGEAASSGQTVAVCLGNGLTSLLLGWGVGLPWQQSPGVHTGLGCAPPPGPWVPSARDRASPARANGCTQAALHLAGQGDRLLARVSNEAPTCFHKSQCWLGVPRVFTNFCFEIPGEKERCPKRPSSSPVKGFPSNISTPPLS